MFDPLDFLNVTRQFSDDGLGEAQYRTAVSRALYAVFLRAREELAARGQRTKAVTDDERPFEHSWVRECFKWSPRERRPFEHYGVSQRLGQLYAIRGRADYNLETRVGKGDVDQALDGVNYIMWVFDDMFK